MRDEHKVLEKDFEKFRHFEKLLKKQKEGKAPESCAKCPFYQPNYRYRTCLYARCPYDATKDVFRKKPLREEKVAGKVVRKMHGCEAG